MQDKGLHVEARQAKTNAVLVSGREKKGSVERLRPQESRGPTPGGVRSLWERLALGTLARGLRHPSRGGNTTHKIQRTFEKGPPQKIDNQ